MAVLIGFRGTVQANALSLWAYAVQSRSLHMSGKGVAAWHRLEEAQVQSCKPTYQHVARTGLNSSKDTRMGGVMWGRLGGKTTGCPIACG